MTPQEISQLEASCAYDVADLAWARIGTYPFWPCIVTRDPYSDLYVKKKPSGRLERNFVHVTFFGDNGRRGWVSENMLRKFLGQLEFEVAREKFKSEDKKKDPKLYAAFFVSEKKQHKWNISVEEAESFLREDKSKRLDLLYDMLIKIKGPKTTPKRDKSIKMRKDSDVSLSESLLDTLFSEDDSKIDDVDRNKNRKKSLDVSEVVTACLDNMAAKTGITKIKKQSHMDSSEESFSENDFKENSTQKSVKSKEIINVDSIHKTQKSISNHEADGLKDLQIINVFSIAEECDDITVKQNANKNELHILESVVESEINDPIVEKVSQKDLNDDIMLQNKMQSVQPLNKNEEVSAEQTDNSSLEKNKVLNNLEVVKTSNLECNSLVTANKSSADSHYILATTIKIDKMILDSSVNAEEESYGLKKPDEKDPLMEENPHLTHNEIVAYLYRTWIFDQDQKPETIKNDSVPHVDLVKGLAEGSVQIQPKKPKKRVRIDKEPQFRNEGVVRDKVERETRKKLIKPFYNEAEDTDTESEDLELRDEVQISAPVTLNNKNTVLVTDFPEDEIIDEVEFYFEQLTQHKPNLFKGLTRERVCDVCEKPGSLSKCKGPCGGFYHVDCAKKEIEHEENQTLHRCRKKKKSRGRKSKVDDNDSKFNGTDSESQEDKSQDNISFDDIEKLEFSFRLEINENDFDAKTTLQLKEMLKECEDDSDAYSNDAWDFEDIVAGKCKIVDVRIELL
ncbi:Histone-lysine N-methyltransferase NSD2 [Eumeta japonica]|uniref:Histone-lysine N-methyltransferase NSD2 n=1 Tax=Eumeta variegata TaxID=151549 RepID=A0A4C1SUN0_EUMVA|nr:Histone-lysine N-methyltransferase NSD2 [Eumeta japonica]